MQRCAAARGRRRANIRARITNQKTESRAVKKLRDVIELVASWALSNVVIYRPCGSTASFGGMPCLGKTL